MLAIPRLTSALGVTLLLAGWLLAGLLLAGCNGMSDAPAPEPTPRPEPTPATPEPTPPEPSTTAACDASRSGASPRARTPDDLRESLPEGRIVGGVTAAPDAFPWAVALAVPLADGTLFQFCGGSLIAPDWVLTAAHCEVSDRDRAIIGRHDLTGSDGEVLEVDFVLTHNDYDSRTNDNDIALVKLANAPASPEVVGLVDAADSSAQAGALSTIIGWGALSEGGATSPTLQQVEIPVVSNAACQAGYAEDNVAITGNMLCAGLEAGQLDSCQGDSGGPLAVRESDAGPLVQAGVVSFGIGCARAGKFGVYTRVSQYRGWIEACRTGPPM